jgi:YVTN family beta-propeller protein
VYLTSGAGDEIIVLSAADGERLATIPVDPRPGELDDPHGIAVSPDGRHLYATVSHGNPSLWKFERPSDRLVGRLDLGGSGAARIAVSPDGVTGYVADYERGSAGAAGVVVAVALGSLEVRGAARPCAGPHDARPGPDGAEIAVACSLSDEVVFLDAGSLAETGRFAAGPEAGPPGRPRYRPMNVAWIDAGTLALTLAGSGEVVAVDRGRGVIRRVAVGGAPAQVALEPRTRRLVVANRGDSTASIVDVATWREEARVPLGEAHPHGVAVDPARGRAFLSYEGDTDGAGGVVALNVRDGRVLWKAAAGSYTLGVAFAP